MMEDEEAKRARVFDARFAYRLLLSYGLDLQRQAENIDEARGILLAVPRSHCERSQVGPVERVRRRAPGDDDVAFIEFQPHVAAHWRRQAVDEGVESLAQRREPLAEIDHLGVFVRDDLFVMRRLAVETERFEFAQRGEQQRPARSLIDAARFHSDQTVFDQIDAATAVATADLVQCFDQRDGVETLSVDLYRRAFFKTDLDVLRLVRRFFGGDGQFEHRLFGFVRGVFEDSAFVREVPDVAVVTVDLFAAGRDRNPALVGVIDRVLARNDVPFAPGGDHRQFGRQGFECQFKTDLIVALARASVRERVAARPLSDFDLAFGDDGSGERSAEQVFVFVDGAGAQRGPDVFGDEFVAQVFDVDFIRARGDGLLLQSG